jgi:hypothetical protein
MVCALTTDRYCNTRNVKGVSWSPNSKADALIVATSFAIPAIDIGTTPTRCIIL